MEVRPLKALAMGACALILLVLPATAQSQSDADLGAQLTRHLSTMKKDQQVLRFFARRTAGCSPTRDSRSRRSDSCGSTRSSLTRTQQQGRSCEDRARARRAQSAPARRGRGCHAAHRHLPRLRRPLPEALAVSRCESGPAAPTPRTASTSACSRWARTSGVSSATATRPSSRPRPPTGTSSPRAATGARGRASPGADLARTFRLQSAGPGLRAGFPRRTRRGRCPSVTWLRRKRRSPEAPR